MTAKTDRYDLRAVDPLIALSLLSRLPLPGFTWPEERAPAAAAWAYPLVGLVVAGIAALIGFVALTLGLSHGVTALIMLATLTITTGAMHEDGLADCADGFWGGWDRPRRLEIMKDSAIGTYGVLALLTVFGLRWLALSELLGAGFGLWVVCIPAVTSRAAMVAVMARLPNAREDGLSKSTGRPGASQMWIAVAIGIAAAVFSPLQTALAVLLVACLSAACVAQLAKAKIGGQTGDVLGATQQISEVSILIVLSARIA